MNGTSVLSGAILVLSIALSVVITNTETTADISVSDWKINGENTVTTYASGVADIEACPTELPNCQVEYDGDITVNLEIVDDALQISPSIEMNNMKLVEKPSEVTSEETSQV